MSRPAPGISPARTDLNTLRERIRHIEAPRSHGVLPFGVAAIDRALPGGGLPLGALHEILGAGADEEDGAAAAGFIAALIARLRPDRFLFPSLPGPGPLPEEGEKGLRAEIAGADPGLVLWCVKQPDLYGPGLLAHGLDPDRIVLVTVRRGDEALWAAEEALRAGPQAGLAAVVVEIGRLPMVAGRRLQFAAERSGITVFVLRRWRGATEAAAERGRPSTALTRWRIAALPSLSGGAFLGNPLPPAGGEGRVRRASPMIALEPPHPILLPRSGSGSDRDKADTGIGRPRWRIELLRVRGGMPGCWEVEVADATGHVCLSAGLADRPAAPQQSRKQLRTGLAAKRAG